jgi:hypothetical protein
MKKEDKYFNVIRLCKEDIIQAFGDQGTGSDFEAVDKNIDNLDDNDMSAIASQLADTLTENYYWDLLLDIIKTHYSDKLKLNKVRK